MIERALKEKEELLKKIDEQMQSDLAAGLISPKALDALAAARTSLRGAYQYIAGETDESRYNVIHFYGRLCWNLGTFTALKPEKKKEEVTE